MEADYERVQEKIRVLELELSRTKTHKGTERHRGELKHQLAVLRSKLSSKERNVSYTCQCGCGSLFGFGLEGDYIISCSMNTNKKVSRPLTEDEIESCVQSIHHNDGFIAFDCPRHQCHCGGMIEALALRSTKGHGKLISDQCVEYDGELESDISDYHVIQRLKPSRR